MSGIDISGIDFRKLEEAKAQMRVPPGWSPPIVMPVGWVSAGDASDGAFWRIPSRGLVAAISCAVELDGRAWLHASVSRRSRIPSWEDVAYVKGVLLGDREGVIVLPPKARYVNIHPNVLHVFALLNPEAETGLPDFTHGTGSL